MTKVLGTPVSNATATTSYTLTVPAGVTPNMIGLFAFSSNTGSSFTPTMASAGATFSAIIDQRTASGTNMYSVVMQGTGFTAGNTITLTVPSARALFVNHFYQDEYAFSTGSFVGAVRPGVSQNYVITGSFTPVSGNKVLVIGMERTNTVGTSVTSATTTVSDTVSQFFFNEAPDATVGSGYFAEFTPMSNTARTATVTWTHSSLNGYVGLLNTVPIPALVGKPIKYVDNGGSLASAQVLYTSSTDILSVPAEVRPVPTGYASVSAMEAATPFYIAHRGGSKDWPEMSLHAYTQSVFWGVGALELSLARTSDGVWFGLHDQTLDRTAGITGFDPAQHTWAEVQAYTIYATPTNTPGQPVRPYMRWEELIKAYYSTHVIFVDIKYASSYRIEMLNMMDALPGNPRDRFVAKAYGVSGGWPIDSRARGYKGWGYFYESDLGNLPTYQARWDYLGMEYSASASAWSAVTSYGKPVISHIAPNSAAVATGASRGAAGHMVAGVVSGVPRTP